MPARKDANILSISCGPGYFVDMMAQEGYTNVLGIDSDVQKIEFARERGHNCVTANAFTYLEEHPNQHDVIFCETEINWKRNGSMSGCRLVSGSFSAMKGGRR